MNVGTKGYKYRAFGLDIISDMLMPELLPADFETAAVTIVQGGVRDDMAGEHNEYADHTSTINATEYYLNIKGVCRYYTDSNAIHYEACAGADERSVRSYMLGSVMAFVLYRGGTVPMHASAIISDGKLVLFTGRSGAGKSTTAALMREKGYPLFTDDICVIDREGSGTASYPMLKLWDESVALLGDEHYATKDVRVRAEMDKHGYFFHDRAVAGAMRVGIIFVIDVDAMATRTVWRELKGVAAFDAVAAQAYRHYLLSEDSLKAMHFEVIARLVNDCRVMVLTRAGQGDNATFVATIEKILKET
jgi:hypothetical protein